MYVWDHLIVKTDTGLVLLYYDPNRWDHWMETSLEQSWYVESKAWNTFNCRKSWIAYIKFNWYLVFLKHTCEIFPTCSSVVLGNKDEKKWKCKCCRNFLYQNQDPWIHQMDQSLRQGKHVNWNSKEVNTYHSHHSAFQAQLDINEVMVLKLLLGIKCKYSSAFGLWQTWFYWLLQCLFCYNNSSKQFWMTTTNEISVWQNEVTDGKCKYFLYQSISKTNSFRCVEITKVSCLS